MNLYFIHGSGGTGDVFAPQLAFFEGAIAPTLPGHSGTGPHPSSIPEFADAVLGEIARHRLRDVVLCGHSMGGAVAMEAALRGQAAVRAIVMLGSGARLRVAPAFIQRLEDDFPAGARTFAGSFFADSAPERIQAAVEVMLRVGREQTVADLRACDAFDATERLGGLSVPLLALTGDADVLTPPKYAQFLADRVPEGQARILPGAGHFAFVERPAETNGAIAEFVERIALR